LFRRNTARVMALFLLAGCTLMAVDAQGVRMGDNGFMEIDGAPFIPVGVYDVNHPDDLFQVKGAGLDVAESMLPDIFRWCCEAKIRSLYWMIAREKGSEEISSVVRSHMSDPSNLAWYTFDEPNEMGIPPSKCKAVYERIKSIDPARPVVLTVSPAYWYHPWSYSAYSNACDIMATDPYPVGIGHGIGLDYVSDCIERARKDSAKPVWAVLQAFPWPGKRPPSPLELRCMTYQALVHGSSGILYYSYQVPAWNYSLVDSPLWAEIRRLSDEVHQLAPALAADGPPPLVNSGVHILKRHREGSTYVMAVNTRDEGKSFEIDLPGSSGWAEVLFSDDPPRRVKGSLEDSLGPLSVRVYKVSEMLTALSSLTLLTLLSHRKAVPTPSRIGRP